MCRPTVCIYTFYISHIHSYKPISKKPNNYIIMFFSQWAFQEIKSSLLVSWQLAPLQTAGCVSRWGVLRALRNRSHGPLQSSSFSLWRNRSHGPLQSVLMVPFSPLPSACGGTLLIVPFRLPSPPAPTM